MPPALARHFVEKFSSPGQLVFDPFCGRGTTLLEAALLGRRTVGLDVAPDAVIVSRAKVDPPTLKEVSAYLGNMVLEKHVQNGASWQVKTFFHRGTLQEIEAVVQRLLSDLRSSSRGTQRTANFVLGTLLGILHGHSEVSLSLKCSHSFAMAPNYVRKYARRHGLVRPRRDVIECLRARTEELLRDGIPVRRGKAFIGDASCYPESVSSDLTNQVDLVVTSPPYLNVQTYAKDSWLRLWVLGHDYKKVRQDSIETGSPSIYLGRIEPCISKILSSLKPGGHAVIVAGDAPFVRCGEKTGSFETALEIARLARQLTVQGYKFRLLRVIQDDIPAHARYYSAVHKDGKSRNDKDSRKGVIVERIVVLEKVRAVNRRSQ